MDLTLDEAVAIVMFEGYPGEEGSDDSLFVLVRMGDDPGTERMEKVIYALNVITTHTGKQHQLDRELVVATWILATEVRGNMQSWARNGLTWRSSFPREVEELSEACHRFFMGVAV